MSQVSRLAASCASLQRTSRRSSGRFGRPSPGTNASSIAGRAFSSGAGLTTTRSRGKSFSGRSTASWRKGSGPGIAKTHASSTSVVHAAPSSPPSTATRRRKLSPERRSSSRRLPTRPPKSRTAVADAVGSPAPVAHRGADVRRAAAGRGAVDHVRHLSAARVEHAQVPEVLPRALVHVAVEAHRHAPRRVHSDLALEGRRSRRAGATPVARRRGEREGASGSLNAAPRGR